MPTVIAQNSTGNLRPKPEIVLAHDVAPRVDAVLHAIINERFEGILKINKLPARETVGQSVWIVSSKDPDYLFGFRVVLKDSGIQVKNGINTWSMWAEDYTRQALAQKLNSKLRIGTKLISPEGPIEDLQSWMRNFGFDTKVNNLPNDFKRVAGLR